MNCETCGGTLVKNGGIAAVQGKRRQFYRCVGTCGLGGWVDVDMGGKRERMRGPAFEGLNGRVSPHLARREASRAARERASVVAGE